MKAFLTQHKKFCGIIFLQLLIMIILLIYSLIVPRTSITLSGTALTETELQYASFQNNALFYDLPYYSSYQASTFALKGGCYHVQVSYTANPLAQSFADTQVKQPPYSIDCVYFSSDTHELNLIDEAIPLTAGQTIATGQIWLTTIFTSGNVSTNIFYSGTQAVSIQSITFTESISYRFAVCFFFIFLMLTIDLCYLFFCKTKDDIELQKRTAFFAVIIIFACYPLFNNFNFWGHDYEFHLARIVSVSQELSYGQFPVRMMTEMVNGYGHPNSIFYCDIFLYLPAILHLIKVPLYQCYQIYIALISIATAGIAYFSFCKIIKSKNYALLGTALYMLSSYRICCIYLRAAVGEYSAITFYPLVAAGAYCIYTKEKPLFKDWILLSLGMAGVIQSHFLSTQIIVIFLALLCVVLLKQTLKKYKFIALLKATITTIGLSCWFLIPFFLSIDDSLRAFGPHELNQIQPHGLYLMQLFSVFTTSTGFSCPTGQSDMPLSLGFSLTIGLGCAFYCILHRNAWKITNDKTYQVLRVCFSFSIIACLLTLQAFPWDSLQYLLGADIASFFVTVQFPWRYLSVAVLSSTIATILALKLIKTFCSSNFKLIVYSILASLVLVNGLFYVNTLNNAPIDKTAMTSSRLNMDICGHHYVIDDTDIEQFVNAELTTESDDIIISNFESIQGKKYLTATNTATKAQWVTFPIQNYPNYHVYDIATREEFTILNGENNNICTYLPVDYNGTLMVCYESPVLWRIAEIISVITTLSVLFYMGKQYRAHHKKATDTDTI